VIAKLNLKALAAKANVVIAKPNLKVLAAKVNAVTNQTVLR